MPRTLPIRSRAAARPRAPQVRSRQERGRRTEAAILAATMDLLAERGVHGMSLDLLAERVGVAKSSILWHFGSKEELLLAVAERVLRDVAEGPVRAMLELPTLEERAEASWDFFTRTLRERPDLRKLLLYLLLASVEERPELRARMRQLYRSIREFYETGLRGVVDDAGRRSRMAVMAVAAHEGIFLQWLLDPEAIDLDALHEEMREAARPQLTRTGDRRG